MINDLLLLDKETRKQKIDNMQDTEKQVLINEINEKTKSVEAELIRLETVKTKLEEDETNLMNSLKELGINSYEDLDKEILKLETDINNQLLDYTEALKGE